MDGFFKDLNTLLRICKDLPKKPRQLEWPFHPAVRR
jgi:hypothetical protein